jgi:threonylcarbamoyladenosine tRNA methylthiotransferase MtaB
MKIFFDMVGCRVNQAEIDAMATEVRALGHEVTGDVKAADWIVINTCTVTREAERDSRQKARFAHAGNPAARLAVTGCWATMEPERAAALPGVARTIPNPEKDRLIPDLLGGEESRGSEELHPSPHGWHRRTRAYIKVQDGCDNACTFCVTRLARGAIRSRNADAVVEDLLAAENAGAKEAVLAGVHLGAWGKDLGMEFGLEQLLETVLMKTTIPRVRLSSLEPWDLRPEFFRLWSDSRLCPHLHLPLQSGCAVTLRRMARRTTPEDFARIADAARAAIPDLAISSDWMVGFPGESESDFRESLDFVERMRFARLHVFRFSSRPGTSAARMKDAVPPQEIRRRAALARQTADRAAESFARGFLGREMDVLWEADTRCGLRHGLTGNFLRVRVQSDSILPNTFSRVKLTGFDQGELAGELASENKHSCSV